MDYLVRTVRWNIHCLSCTLIEDKRPDLVFLREFFHLRLVKEYSLLVDGIAVTGIGQTVAEGEVA